LAAAAKRHPSRQHGRAAADGHGRNIALRNCCDIYGPDGAIVKFEVKAGDTTKVFLFKMIKLGR